MPSEGIEQVSSFKTCINTLNALSGIINSICTLVRRMVEHDPSPCYCHSSLFHGYFNWPMHEYKS
ncbi:conserved hypothetical protein [Ricinus communis]|uniref:Uncharacterized protein n=1 Tax=Ricinus communis TaxID=3988 RepID=B9RW12_RICCO|nr:conserved hypothetical protein [Ricinus communis]